MNENTRMPNGPLFPDVGVIALIDHHWDGNWMDPHQVLTRLSRYFHVLWLDPAHEWRNTFSDSRVRFGHSVRSTEHPGFFVQYPEAWLPTFYRPEWLGDFTIRQRHVRARQFLLKKGCSKIILYLWRPEFEAALSTIPSDLSCYHIDDEYSFSTEEQPLDPDEVRLLNSVDRVFVSSPALMDKKGDINPNTSATPNGVDYTAFATALAEPSDLASIPRPRIGYTGVLKKQLDWSLLLRMTEKHPDWSFVFVGPVTHDEIAASISELDSRPNVHFLGAKTTEQLRCYPQHFDVCIMPYVLNDYTKYIYPLKLHEYLASGRPTVGTPIRSLQDFSDSILLAQTHEEWSAALLEAMSPAQNDAVAVGARQLVARKHDWGVIVGNIATLMAEGLDEQLGKKIRIVVEEYLESLDKAAT